jgi:Mn2+/Fe2+ NRAMP family transporter
MRHMLHAVVLCCVQGYVIQMQAAKLGVVTRRHLAEHCRWAQNVW